MRFSPICTSVLSVVVALAGCRSGGGDDDPVDATVTTTDGGVDGSTTDGSQTGTSSIQRIQMGMDPDGAIVTVTGAVVTAVKMRTCGMSACYDVWVQESAGGPYSGVLLFNVPMAVATTLTRGDEVSFTGEVDEFMATGTTPDTDSVTEVKVSSVTKTGSGRTAQVTTVAATALATGTTAERYEGVLVKVENFTVANVRKSSNVPTTWNIWGGGQVDDELFALPDTVDQKACVRSVVGPLHYFYGFKIFPRDASDLDTAAGTGCPAYVAEFSSAQCMDTLDNDFDGFYDCATTNPTRSGDFSCEAYCASAGQLPTPTTLTVAALRATPPANTVMVKLQDVYVTAIDTRVNTVSASAVNSIWVSDAATATPNTSVMVFQPNQGDVSGLSVGQRVTVYGKVTQFALTGGGSETELARDVYLVPTAGAAVTVVPADVQLSALAVPATAETYEGALVRLALVKAQANPVDGEVTLAGTGGTIVATDNFMDLASVTANTCYATVTGVIRHARCGATGSFSACYKIEPRSSADLVAGSGCP